MQDQSSVPVFVFECSCSSVGYIDSGYIGYIEGEKAKRELSFEYFWQPSAVGSEGYY